MVDADCGDAAASRRPRATRGGDPEAACAEALPRRAALRRDARAPRGRPPLALPPRVAWTSARRDRGRAADRRAAGRGARPERDDPGLAAAATSSTAATCSSPARGPARLPANLQGLWNEDLNPPWDSKYTININTEMNYWPAEVGNLAECHEPLFDLVEWICASRARARRGRTTARAAWSPITTPTSGASRRPSTAPRWGLWPMGGAWLSPHLWEHYAFGGDRRSCANAPIPCSRRPRSSSSTSWSRTSRAGW